MKERPIVFSGPMIRALLSGQKTQTRRLARDAPGWADHAFETVGGEWGFGDNEERGEYRRCPYGVPGDRLWVRETWRSWEERCDDGTGGQHDYDTPCGPHCAQTYVAYAATPRRGYRPKPDRASIAFLDKSTPLDRYHESLEGPWRPSSDMPRWASRLTLELTDVRVQRLQGISKSDAAAEGACRTPAGCCARCNSAGRNHTWPQGCPSCSGTGHENLHNFAELWDSINGKRAPWDSNPWVWAITFRSQHHHG